MFTATLNTLNRSEKTLLIKFTQMGEIVQQHSYRDIIPVFLLDIHRSDTSWVNMAIILLVQRPAACCLQWRAIC